MTGLFRLPRGGRVDRSRPLAFTFDGRRLEGLAGDTLASALLANGVHHVARSFKYHRPRGILAAGSEEPNALVQLGTGASTTPNLQATRIELYDGLAAASVNRWPSLRADLGSVADLVAPLLVAGFYYKTFKSPVGAWERLYEPAIRRRAGMGVAPMQPDPDRYEHVHRHVDVLVVGAGPAGLAAAGALAATGARVLLADEQVEPGGALLAARDRIDDAPAMEWVARTQAVLASTAETLVLRRTTAFGLYDHNYVCLLEQVAGHQGSAGPADVPHQRLWHVRAREIVLATGAHERPLVFPGNDRPGVMLAGSVRAYLNRWAVLPGRCGVVFADTESAYATALELAEAGVEITAIVDPRADPPEPAVELARRSGIDVRPGAAVIGTGGRRRLRWVDVARLSPQGGVDGGRERIPCDFLATSGGWSPAVHLFSQAQGRLAFDETHGCLVPAAPVSAVQVAGAAAGAFGLDACLATGRAAGIEAARRTGFESGAEAPSPRVEPSALGTAQRLVPAPAGAPFRHGRGRAFVDFQNDVTAADIALAAREGMRSIEHVKRYTTTGMGTDQGKTSNVNALALLADTLAKPAGAVGHTTYRPPYTPVTYGAIAGRFVGRFADAVRRTPMHRWHEAAGAVFEDVGQWKRPRWYPQAGEEMREAVARECRAVREGVGVLDASTLGKIDIAGPDAVELLNRVYVNAWTRLGIARCRYGVMCRDDGMVFDDGVTTRLADDRFHMTTTTGNAGPVLDWLEEWLQTEWPDLRAYCTSVTEQWAVIAVSGPKARAVLSALAPGLDLDPRRFPFMFMQEAEVAGVPARIFRISFHGGLCYEVNVPWRHGLAVWEAVMEAGREHGITPYGTEAMHVLRAEKGFIIVGQETDGTVTPLDLGMERLIARRKPDFIGRRSLLRPDTARTDRKQLVGLLPTNPEHVLAEGAQIVGRGNPEPPEPMLGHVTSSYWSPALERGFALALVKSGRERIAETLWAWHLGETAPVEVVRPPFWDPEGERIDG